MTHDELVDLGDLLGLGPRLRFQAGGVDVELRRMEELSVLERQRYLRLTGRRDELVARCLHPHPAPDLAAIRKLAEAGTAKAARQIVKLLDRPEPGTEAECAELEQVTRDAAAIVMTGDPPDWPAEAFASILAIHTGAAIKAEKAKGEKLRDFLEPPAGAATDSAS